MERDTNNPIVMNLHRKDGFAIGTPVNGAVDE